MEFKVILNNKTHKEFDWSEKNVAIFKEFLNDGRFCHHFTCEVTCPLGDSDNCMYKLALDHVNKKATIKANLWDGYADSEISAEASKTINGLETRTKIATKNADDCLVKIPEGYAIDMEKVRENAKVLDQLNTSTTEKDTFDLQIIDNVTVTIDVLRARELIKKLIQMIKDIELFNGE
jgi:hypothetical protein